MGQVWKGPNVVFVTIIGERMDYSRNSRKGNWLLVWGKNRSQTPKIYAHSFPHRLKVKHD